MNGGGPLATSLRALRHAPVVVDDVGILPRLAAAAGVVADGRGPLDAQELVRWTRAWIVAWQGALHERGVIGSAPPWTVPLPLAEVPTLKGDPEGRRREAALALLERASLLVRRDQGVQAALAEDAFVPHRAGLEIAWGAVCHAVRLEPAPLLVARALAELVVPPDEPTPVTLRELGERTGYAPKQVRLALRRLVTEGVLVESEVAGMATQYCFGAVALPQASVGPSAGAGAREAVRPHVTSPAAGPGAAPSPPVAAQRGRAVALRLTLNGVTLSLGVGLAPHVELGPDGVPHVSFDPPEGA